MIRSLYFLLETKKIPPMCKTLYNPAPNQYSGSDVPPSADVGCWRLLKTQAWKGDASPTDSKTCRKRLMPDTPCLYITSLDRTGSCVRNFSIILNGSVCSFVGWVRSPSQIKPMSLPTMGSGWKDSSEFPSLTTRQCLSHKHDNRSSGLHPVPTWNIWHGGVSLQFPKWEGKDDGTYIC